LLAPRPNPKLENHPLSAVRDSLFNISAANLRIGGRSSIRNLKTRHAMVTVTHFVHNRRYSSREVPSSKAKRSDWYSAMSLTECQNKHSPCCRSLSCLALPLSLSATRHKRRTPKLYETVIS